MAEARLTVGMRWNGVTVTRTQDFTSDGDASVGPTTLAAGKAGTLSTRTDANTGVVTLDSGHGFNTSDRVAVSWADASGVLQTRFYMEVTDSKTTTANVDGGTGTDLPAQGYSVVVGKVTSEALNVDPSSSTATDLKPTTAFTFSATPGTAKAVGFFANASDVGGGTLSFGKLVYADGSDLPTVLFGGYGDWANLSDADTFYMAAASTTAPTVTARSLYM